MARVIVGMSGGVDSTTAAYLLKLEGYDVVGVTFKVWDTRSDHRSAACCSTASALAAKRYCSIIGIPHHVVDVRGEFIDSVIDPFVESYRTARTPNPCILCNDNIKFPILSREAKRLDAEFIATGHYAIITKDYRLRRGIDCIKDQSYFLYTLNKATLGRTLMPLGRYTKTEVREIAHAAGLSKGDGVESQDICFIPDGDYRKFLLDYIPDISSGREGVITDRNGAVLGRHNGMHGFTIGQRRGLGIAAGYPLYVLDLDYNRNVVIVGRREECYAACIEVRDVCWHIDTGLHFDEGFTIKAGVRIRSTMSPVGAVLSHGEGGAVCVSFDTPQWGAAPGQAAVFYDGDLLIGGGVIA